MLNQFQNKFSGLTSLIEKREYNKLSNHPIDVPEKFNWVRDVFEPLIVQAHADRNILELVTDDPAETKTITYQQGVEKCNQLLNFLRKQDVQQGDSLFIMCGLNEGLWISYLSAIKGGLVLIPAASILRADDIVYRFQKAAPKVIVADLENAEKMEQALLQYSHPVKAKLLLEGKRNGWMPFSAIDTEEKEASAADTHKYDDLFWFFTSGTTGMPKVVVHTQASYPLGHLTTAAWIGLKPGDKHYNISQPGWAKFAWSCVFAPLNIGATVFVYSSKGRFIASKQLKIIQEHKVTTLCAPPTALRLLIQENLNEHSFSLRECVSAGEPLNAEVIKIWKDGTGLELRDGYGQTESTCMICNLPGSQLKFGSMGKPAFLYDMMIADADGNELPVHETGQIAVRMHPDRFNGIFKSYIGDDEKQKEVFKHGLYYTGDKAYKDEDGYYWFVGRDDDVIKSSDYRIGPFEIESILLELDEVLESAVVGSPHPIKGQEVKAFVVLTPDVTPTKELSHKIFHYCKSHLSPYKVPRIIEFVTELPKTISGKIRRIELRAAEEHRKAMKERGNNEYFGAER
ncbi:MAG: branched-chain amino acid aminotransferase [Chitinophagaceae bacterium]|nr:MAG: branched-chain amino acid aminotransferase [Chitinophagaceae bacterium]